MEDQKNQNQPIPFKKTPAWKKFLGKKWAFPALYIGTAAIILAFVMWYQNMYSTPTPDQANLGDEVSVATTDSELSDASGDMTEEAVPVTNAQTWLWPVAQGVEYEVQMEFFDDQASKEEQQAALVKYDNSYVAHTGIDIVAKDGNAFEVTATADGKVTKVKNDPLVGNLVEIEHPDKVVSVYQSLDSVTVKPGDEVKQGQVIGKAGRNVYEKDAGVHLHFEVRADGKSVNPEQYLKQVETQ